MHSVERLSTLVARGAQDTRSTDVVDQLKEALDTWEERGMTLLAVVPSDDGDHLFCFHVGT